MHIYTPRGVPIAFLMENQEIDCVGYLIQFRDAEGNLASAIQYVDG